MLAGMVPWFMGTPIWLLLFVLDTGEFDASVGMGCCIMAMPGCGMDGFVILLLLLLLFIVDVAVSKGSVIMS